MNYNKPPLIRALSAEYVLGTLRGKARDKFEKLKFSNENIQNEVAFWESKLNTMSLNVAPVEPDKKVWSNIQDQLGFESPTKTETAHSTVVPVDFGKQKDSPWKWTSGLAIAASLILSILLFTTSNLNQTATVTSIAVVTNADSKLLWSFNVTKNDIEIQKSRLVPSLPNNDYQLWIVPASGDAPISIGVMPQESALSLEKPAIFDRIQIAALAVSKEPKGGSPTGAPTEVLYAAELAIL